MHPSAVLWQFFFAGGYLSGAESGEQRVCGVLLERYDDHSLDLAVSDRVPQLGRCAGHQRTVGHTHQPRVTLHLSSTDNEMIRYWLLEAAAPCE